MGILNSTLHGHSFKAIQTKRLQKIGRGLVQKLSARTERIGINSNLTFVSKFVKTMILSNLQATLAHNLQSVLSAVRSVYRLK